MQPHAACHGIGPRGDEFINRRLGNADLPVGIRIGAMAADGSETAAALMMTQDVMNEEPKSGSSKVTGW